MTYSNNYHDLKNQFIREKIKKKYDLIKCKDIENKECFIEIVNLCFNGPMTPRLIPGLRAFRKNDENEKIISNILKDVSNSLFDYIHSEKEYSKEDFDNYHENISIKFMNAFNNLIRGKQSSVLRNKKIFSVTMKEINYGQAQKLINLSIKWLFCMNGAEKYLQKFNYCHVALDGVTYSKGWYHRVVNRGAVCCAWSKLTLEKYRKVQLDFRYYITTSRYHTTSNVILSPFQAEFYVWNEYNWVIK